MTAKCCKNIRHGAMEGTRTPGLLIRRNRIAHFVHFIIRREIVILIELPLFCRCHSIASFALFALLCTCYPSLRCAENVQKCAETKSARQNSLKMSDFSAGFLGHRQCKNFQFHPDNNLTWHIGFMAGVRTSEQTPFDIEMRFTISGKITDMTFPRRLSVTFSIWAQDISPSYSASTMASNLSTFSPTSGWKPPKSFFLTLPSEQKRLEKWLVILLPATFLKFLGRKPVWLLQNIGPNTSNLQDKILFWSF